MTPSPRQILENAYITAQAKTSAELLSELPHDMVENLRTVIAFAESQKAVLGVILTSITHKIYAPNQDIRYHQEQLLNGYSGRGFDTLYVTPFLQEKFHRFAMAESAWLTRSLEQPHPYDANYPGRIRDKILKKAFLEILDRVQIQQNIAPKLLVTLLALLQEISVKDESLVISAGNFADMSIAQILEAVSKHIYRSDNASRIPVVAIYAVYRMLINDVRRYEGKTLARLALHTAADSRSQALGDIEILNSDGSHFEAVEIKHQKPISTHMINTVFRKIQNKAIDRYYILTTHDPNVNDINAVNNKIDEIRKRHSCQIIVNGVLPSLKYYLRLVNNPETFIKIYTECLQAEFELSNTIRARHLELWAEIIGSSPFDG